MVPEFNEGDIVVVSPHSRAASGAYVVVKNDKEDVTLKQFKKYGTKRILHPLNPKYQDIELSDKKQYRIVGRIMENGQIKNPCIRYGHMGFGVRQTNSGTRIYAQPFFSYALQQGYL